MKDVKTINQNESQQRMHYVIADLLMEIYLPRTVNSAEALPSFAPFLVEHTDGDPILSVTVGFEKLQDDMEQTKLLSEESLVWGDHFQFRESENYYYTILRTSTKQEEWKMRSSKDFFHNEVYAVENEIQSTTVLSWLLMVTFAQSALRYQTLLVHASVVEKQGGGVAFLGKSGTGKSTHSRLWLTYLSGYQLLNDDNPAIRIAADNKVWIYGTPWSGKTPCYRNVGVALRAVIRLSQAKENKLEWKRGKEALITLLPSGSGLRWNSGLFGAMTSIFQRVQEYVPVGHLNCLPNAEAALLCETEIEQKQINEVRE
ncbi:hypothetical protein [Sphingobacterium griseoflavum]|uniref:Phosphoenolpyruvate carboxykinase n=1 Tax=Sphingobacterium griseoflavum TaxID=1474952 RepID=A0ABQ3HWY6_9SPHI|nr:hypothetical protein [Sphingobacterium griseoflavum]GHE39840.1 hypothetical protein GCM10017764_23970 [Sphingobacterium griseoflavum]